jgi:hypothetical protein
LSRPNIGQFAVTGDRRSDGKAIRRGGLLSRSDGSAKLLLSRSDGSAKFQLSRSEGSAKFLLRRSEGSAKLQLSRVLLCALYDFLF